MKEVVLMQFHHPFRVLVVPVALLVAIFSSCQLSGSLSMVSEGSLSATSENIHTEVAPAHSEVDLFIPSAMSESLLAAIDDGGLYDVFISHAGEEKESLAIPLYDELKKLGLRPFLDRRTLPYGKEIPAEIKLVLDRSQSGIFILSPNFIAQKWPMYELTYLQNRKESASSTGGIAPDLLPVFYKCSKDDCQLPWPSLRKKYEKYFRRHQFQDRVGSDTTACSQLSTALSDLSKCRGFELDADAKSSHLLWWIGKTAGALYTMLRSPSAQARSYYSQRYATISTLFSNVNKPVADLPCTLQCISDKRKVEANNFLGDEIAMHYERCTWSREPIARENIFQDRSVRSDEPARPVQRVLLIGLPGVGKTTLAQQLAYLWSQGLWGQEFKTVYLLFVRALQSSKYDDSTYSKRPALSTAIVNSCFASPPDNESEYNVLWQQVDNTLKDPATLVILDGLDEREASHAPRPCAQAELLRAAETGSHKLLMLSRAYSVEYEHSIADLEIEHVGLSDIQLEGYLQEEALSGLSSGQGADLLSSLRHHPSMFSMAHVPINLSLLCYFYANDVSSVTDTIRQGSLPLLYKHLTEYIWSRYEDNVPGLPDAGREHIFSVLGELALSALRTGKILVDHDVLTSKFGIDLANQLLALQTSYFLLLKFSGSTNQYQFPHLTFQEYFAARCLADQLTSRDAATRSAGARNFLDMCCYSRYGRTLSFVSGALSEREGTVGIRRLLSLGASIRESLAQTDYALLQLRLLNEWLCLSESVVIEAELPDLLADYQTSSLLQVVYDAVLKNVDSDSCSDSDSHAGVVSYRQFTRSVHAFGFALQYLPVYWKSVVATIQEADDTETRALATTTLGDLVKASPSLASDCLPALLAAVGDESHDVYNAASDGLLAVSQGLAYHAKLERDLPALCACVSGLLADVQQRCAFHWTLLSLVQTNPSRSALGLAQEQVASARLDALLSLSPPPLRHIFGAQEWGYYYGDVGEEPDLPVDIDAVLDRACPFWNHEGKKVRDTHFLILIPASVDGKNFSLDLLCDFITYPACVMPRTKYRWYDSVVRSAFGSLPSGKSYWILMTRDVLPGSRNKPYADQKMMVDAYASQDYVLPQALEAATSILTHHVRTGERLFPADPLTYTRCSEQVGGGYPLVVGGFCASGIDIDYSFDDLSSYGVSCCRKF